jgi:hypothetical protein
MGTAIVLMPLLLLLLLLLLLCTRSGLVCPKGFPAAFGSFPALETLMLRFNDFSGDTLGHVAEVRKQT